MSMPPPPPDPPPDPPNGPPTGPPTGWQDSGPGAGMPQVPSPDERNWALAAHVGTLILGFVAPLITLLAKGNESQFIRRHSVESLNFQISLMIYLMVSFVLWIVLVGFLFTIGVAVFALVVIILATIAASNGQDYRYPLTIRLVS